MKKLTLTLLLFFTTISSNLFAQEEPKNIVQDPNAQVRTVSDFTGIEIKGGCIVYISQGTENAVAVSGADENSTNNIEAIVKNGILSFHTKGVSRGGIKAYITVTNLQIVDVSGASIVKFVNAINVQSLKADISGASVLKGEVKGNEIILDVSGASSVSISGKVAQTRLLASGASTIKAYELISTQSAVVDASGASYIKANAENKITIRASGSSNVKYKGDANNVTQHTSGSSNIKNESDSSNKESGKKVTINL